MKGIVAFIVARLLSSRLPEKQLRKIGDRKLIDWTIGNLRRSGYIDKIVIATTSEEGNAPLSNVAEEHGVDVFWYDGDPNDVVGRLTQASREFRAEIPVLISGDCPLIWAPSLDRLIESILESDFVDGVGFCDMDGRGVIHEGMGVYRQKCWEIADKISSDPSLREHHFPVVKRRKDIFRTKCVYDDELFYRVNHRISVDTMADLDFMNRVYRELRGLGREFNLPNVVKLLVEKPDLMRINSGVHQMDVGEKQRKALFVVKGVENLDVLLGMAYDLTKRGVGVRFFASSENLKRAISEKGFGAFLESDSRADYDITVEEKG